MKLLNLAKRVRTHFPTQIRLQLICFMLGSIALWTVRRQKSSSATLFDQRRSMRRTVSISKDISNALNFELPELNGNSEGNGEMEPLTAKPLDIV